MARITWDTSRISEVRTLLAEALTRGITVKSEAFAYVSNLLPENPGYGPINKVVWTHGLWDQALEITSAGGASLNVSDTVPQTHVSPTFPDLKESEFNWREWIDTAIEISDLNERAGTAQNTCTVDLSTVDRPIAVMFSADWHLGALGTDYTTWYNDMQYLLDTPGLYLAGAGDYKENIRYFKSLQSILSQVFPPQIQDRILAQVAGEMAERGKLLFMTWGNHDYEWDINQTGHAEHVARFHEAGIPYLSGQGLVNLDVGAQRYTTLVLHKTRFSSYLHTLHGSKRMYETMYPARIVVSAHTHNPDFETFTRYELAAQRGEDFGGTSYLIKCGTYKTNDGYSLRHFGSPR